MDPDVLGGDFEAQTLPLAPDGEGEVVATLVRRRCPGSTGRAVLYVHGFSDYFFQVHVADWYVARGFDFYALDLRKCGRSWRAHQTAQDVADLEAYFEELDAAARIVRDVDGARTLLVNAHSAGGLTTALWAHARRSRGIVDGLFLNSPFLDLNASALSRALGEPLVAALARLRPAQALPFGLPQLYGASIDRDQHGEWTFDHAWKPLDGTPIRAGWLAAIRRGQRRVHRGLAIDCPVLVLCSARSLNPKGWEDALLRADTILDVDQIVHWAPRLGPDVTCTQIEGGMHDLMLSTAPVRARAFATLGDWIADRLPAERDAPAPHA